MIRERERNAWPGLGLVVIFPLLALIGIGEGRRRSVQSLCARTHAIDRVSDRIAHGRYTLLHRLGRIADLMKQPLNLSGHTVNRTSCLHCQSMLLGFMPS